MGTFTARPRVNIKTIKKGKDHNPVTITCPWGMGMHDSRVFCYHHYQVKLSITKDNLVEEESWGL